MTDLSQYDHLSDADLEAIANGGGDTAPTDDYSHLSDEELTRIAGESPPPSQENTSDDMLKSLVSGVERGIVATPMVLPNLLNQAAAGPQLLYRGIMDTFQGKPTTKNPDIWQPFYSSEDVLKGNTPIGMIDALKPHDATTNAGALADIAGQFMGGLGATKALNKVATPAPEKLTSQDVRQMSRDAYELADQHGGVLTPKVTDSFINDASSVLPQTPAGKIVLGETPTTKLVERLQSLRGKQMTLSEAQEIDSALNDAMSTSVHPTTGKLDAEGHKLLKIQQSLRDSIDNASQADIIGGKNGFDTWNRARKLWGTSARMNDIERIIDRASMTDNPVTSIKTGFRTLASNPTRIRGYSAPEQAAIRNAAKTGAMTGALRIAGSRLNPIIGGATGGFTGAAAGYGVSEASRAMANKLQLSRANKALQTVASGAVPPNNVQPTINPNAKPALSALIGGVESENNDEATQQEQKVTIEPMSYEGSYIKKTDDTGEPDIGPESLTVNDILDSENARKPKLEIKKPEPSPVEGVPHSFLQEEGVKSKVYRDKNGNRTVGIGFNMDNPVAKSIWDSAGMKEDFAKVRAGQQPISEVSAHRLLKKSYEIASEDIKKLVPNFDKLGKNQQEAATHLAFQYGRPRLKESLPGVLSMLNQGNGAGAAARLLSSDYGKQFKKRAKAIARMLYNDEPYQEASL